MVQPGCLLAVWGLAEHIGDGRCLDGRQVQVGVVDPHAGRFECSDHHSLDEAGRGKGESLVEGGAVGGLPGRVAPTRAPRPRSTSGNPSGASTAWMLPPRACALPEYHRSMTSPLTLTVGSLHRLHGMIFPSRITCEN